MRFITGLRPLVNPSPTCRRAEVRRRPRVRKIPRGGPVILASSAEERWAGKVQGRAMGRGEKDMTHVHGRKRPRGFGSDDHGQDRFDEPRPVKALKPFLGSPSDMEDSWSALRRVLHERYRDYEERGAAEEASMEASRGRDGGVGYASRSAELIGPGLRVFRRQEHAFAYLDAVTSRLAPRDVAWYKVFSFETNSTGSRRFLVCDLKKFEEHYPFVARANEGVLANLCVNLARHGPISQAADATGKRGSTITSPDTRSSPSAPGSSNPRPEALGEARKGYISSSNASTTSASSRVPSPLAHVYEIIREGSPCRMYFDLEFSRLYNDGLDGEALVQAWVNVVAGKLLLDLGISVGRTDFLDLDSSTPKKFSRHLILHLPQDQLFEDNSHVGRFVNSLAADLELYRPRSDVHGHGAPHTSVGEVLLPRGPVSSESIECVPPRMAEQIPSSENTVSPSPIAREASGFTCSGYYFKGSWTSETACVPPDELRDAGAASEVVILEGVPDARSGLARELGPSRGSSEALQTLWVRDGDGRHVLFADVSVYTRNRCFRLPGSSKFGKTVQLEVATSNRRTLDHMHWTGGSKLEPRHVARAVLHDSLVVPAELRPEGERYLSVGGEGPHRYSRVLATTRDKRSRVISGSRGTGGSRVMSVEGKPGSAGRTQRDRDSWRVDSSGFGSSPFPAVDEFLRKLVCTGGVRGDLRQWSYTASERRVPGRVATDEKEQGQRAVPEGPGGVACYEGIVTRLLTHQVSNNRWCHNIDRAHKSNHVFLVTDLTRGEVRQHCHDQDCRRSGYRSNPVRLPPDVCPSRDDLEAYELEVGLAIAMGESPADWETLA